MPAPIHPFKTFPGISRVISCISYQQVDRYNVILDILSPFKNTDILNLIERANLPGLDFSIKLWGAVNHNPDVSLVTFTANKNGLIELLKFLFSNALINRNHLNEVSKDLDVILNVGYRPTYSAIFNDPMQIEPSLSVLFGPDNSDNEAETEEEDYQSRNRARL